MSFRFPVAVPFSLSTTAVAVSAHWEEIDVRAGNPSPITEGSWRITLEQVKQQAFVNIDALLRDVVTIRAK